MTPVLHPKTHEPILPAPGLYILINGRYYDRDHSGGGADGEADELWAVLFTECEMHRNLRANVRMLLNEILTLLQVNSTGQGVAEN